MPWSLRVRKSPCICLLRGKVVSRVPTSTGHRRNQGSGRRAPCQNGSSKRGTPGNRYLRSYSRCSSQGPTLQIRKRSLRFLVAKATKPVRNGGRTVPDPNAHALSLHSEGQSQGQALSPLTDLQSPEGNHDRQVTPSHSTRAGAWAEGLLTLTFKTPPVRDGGSDLLSHPSSSSATGDY